VSSLVRNVGTIGALTAVSRVFGFVRDMLLSRVLGAGLAADAWQLAFTLPNTFRRLFAEGAFSVAFVPMYSRALHGDGGEPAADEFAGDVLSVAESAPEGVLITDAGSTKRAMVEAARALPERLQFVGGHPLAGAARGGIEASRPDLFERRPWVLTPDLSTPRATVDRLAGFVRALGGSPFELDPETHDHVLAYTSHLPQLTASALMHVVGEAVGENGLQLSGGGLADTTRVAASPARIWSDICATNADQILPALDRLIATLQEMRAHLTDGGVDPLFESARRWRGRIRS